MSPYSPGPALPLAVFYSVSDAMNDGDHRAGVILTWTHRNEYTMVGNDEHQRPEYRIDQLSLRGKPMP